MPVLAGAPVPSITVAPSKMVLIGAESCPGGPAWASSVAGNAVAIRIGITRAVISAEPRNRPARMNSRADTSQSNTKNPFRPRISTTELTGECCLPMISAITATSAWASAAATSARAMPRARKRTIMAPTMPTAITPP